LGIKGHKLSTPALRARDPWRAAPFFENRILGVGAWENKFGISGDFKLGKVRAVDHGRAARGAVVSTGGVAPKPPL
jgi:hypothetical protein